MNYFSCSDLLVAQQMLLIKLHINRPSVSGEEAKIGFKDSCNCGHLGFPICSKKGKIYFQDISHGGHLGFSI